VFRILPEVVPEPASVVVETAVTHMDLALGSSLPSTSVGPKNGSTRPASV
jgi:hypothetical protein